MAYAFPTHLQRLVDTQMSGGDYVSEDDLLLDAMQALAATKERFEQLRDEIRSRIETAKPGSSQPLDLASFQAEARARLASQE